MSDGPHRSLPLRKHWKTLAERAAKEAYPVNEVGEALAQALQKEFLEAPLAEICQILDGKGQASFFSDTEIDRLEELRESHRGSSATNILIDCAVDTLNAGITGKPASIIVLRDALAGYSFNASRSIEEHYLREAGSKDATFVRNRLGAAYLQCNFDNIASEMLAGSAGHRMRMSLPRNLGIDAGPPL